MAADKLATMSQMIEAITSNAQQALVLHSINKLPSYDRTLIDKFNNTYAAHVFTLLRNQISLSTILALSRIWDQTRNVQSIPTLLSFLKDSTVIEFIIARRRESELTLASQAIVLNPGENEGEVREALNNIAVDDADRAECEIRKSVPILINGIETFLNGSLNASVRNLRDKQIAHSIEFTRAEMKAQKSGYSIAPVTIGDIEPALRETVKIIKELNLLIRDLHVNLDSIEQIYAEYAEEFWGRIS